MKKPNEFDLELNTKDGVAVRIIGTVDPGEAPTGPTYDCGGTPGMPAHVDDYKVFDENGQEIDDSEGKILDDLEDEILESFADAEYNAMADAAEAKADAEDHWKELGGTV